MLSCHSQIGSESELWFLLPHVDAIKNQYSKSLFSFNSLGNATNSLLTQLPGGDEDYYAALRAMADGIYERLAVNEETYILDKTPRYYFIIREIERMYPDAKFIFLFRHPFAVVASVTESFNRGRLGDYTHRVDLFEGPRLLADGYRNFSAPHIALRYEDLVQDPETWLARICDYLEIPFERGMIDHFSDVPVGALGDQFGSKRLSTVSAESRDKWKDIFNTGYRKRYLARYLSWVGRANVDTFGYDYDAISDELAATDPLFSFSLRDRWRELVCRIYSFAEVPLLVRRVKDNWRRKSKYYIHH
jgi:hypothetical protein